MNAEEIIMVCCSDLSGHVKGKAFPATDREKRMTRGIGWVPTNAQITAFDTIAETPFGPLGDLLLVPDPDAEVNVDFGDGSPREHWFLGNILHTDGTAWECCLRGILADALTALKDRASFTLKSAFEMELQFPDPTFDHGPSFGLSGFRRKKDFGTAYLAALRAAGVEPDSFLREWGARQYEVTMHPQHGMKAADHAVMMREIARATADRMGERITFTPISEIGGVGNGVHIHMSLIGADGAPAMYDPDGPGGLSKPARHYAAGILHHLPAIVAFTAPSAVSYARLTPHRWSAAFNNLGYRDREAAVRICPVADLPGMSIADQFHIEFRAGDSAASPYLQLAALVLAGLDGIRNEMEPPEPTHEDLSLLAPDELARRGFARLPTTLEAALEALESSQAVQSWFRAPFPEVYLKHKRGELAFLAGMTPEEIYRAYTAVY